MPTGDISPVSWGMNGGTAITTFCFVGIQKAHLLREWTRMVLEVGIETRQPIWKSFQVFG